MKKAIMTKQRFKNQWLRHFASGITRKQFERYVKDQYIWHVFSFKLIEPENLLVGEAANKAFNEVDKTQCLCCDLVMGAGITDYIPFGLETAEDIIENMSEFYVVAMDYSWTYIRAEEIGQTYFLKKTK